MGLFDDIKAKASELIDQHGDKVSEGVDKAASFADEKTGGKYSEQIQQGQQKAKDALDGLDGQQDDFSTGVTAGTPEPTPADVTVPETAAAPSVEPTGGSADAPLADPAPAATTEAAPSQNPQTPAV